MIKLENISAQLRSKVEDELEKQLRDIPRIVENVIVSAVTSIIGVAREGGGGYRVDTFGKREQCLHGYINKKVDESLEKIVGPLVEKELKRLLKLVSLQKSLADRIASNVQYTFERKFKDQVHDRFEKLGIKMANQISDELQKILDGVAQFNDEICNPESFQGRIGALFLEEIAKEVSQTT